MVKKADSESSLSDPVALEIYPWWSGIYALEDSYRAGGVGNVVKDKVPAILSAYATEFGELCLLMHVLDYTQRESDRFNWCNWTGVSYNGGNRVRLYGRLNDDWDLHFDREEEIDSSGGLSVIYKEGHGRNEGGKEVATFLLPYLPKVKDLSICVGVSDLAAPDCLLSEIRETPLIKPLLGLEVIPLVKTCFDDRWKRFERYEMPLGNGYDVTNQ